MEGELCRSDRGFWRGALARVPVPCGLPPSVNLRCSARLASTNGWLTASASIGRRGTRLGEGWAPPIPISIAPPCPLGTLPASPCALPPSLLASLSLPFPSRLPAWGPGTPINAPAEVVSSPKLCNASETSGHRIVDSCVCVASRSIRSLARGGRARAGDQRWASRCQERCATAATPTLSSSSRRSFHPSALSTFLKWCPHFCK